METFNLIDVKRKLLKSDRLQEQLIYYGLTIDEVSILIHETEGRFLCIQRGDDRFQILIRDRETLKGQTCILMDLPSPSIFSHRMQTRGGAFDGGGRKSLSGGTIPVKRCHGELGAPGESNNDTGSKEKSEVATMKTWHCNDCETDFNAERSTACQRCGLTDISCLGEIASPGRPSQSQEGEIIPHILKELCFQAYENPYNGREWEEAIDKTIVKLRPYLKDVERVTVVNGLEITRP
jgi:hypothetical protein